MADRKAKGGKPAKVEMPVRAKAAPSAPPVLPVTEIAEEDPVSPPFVTAAAEAAPAAPSLPIVEVCDPVLPAPLPIEAIQPVINIEPTINEGNETMNAQINETIQANQDAAQATAERFQETGRVATDRIQAMFGDVNERAKTAMEKNAKIVQEMTDLTKGNVEAVVASSRVAARGFENLGREAADFGRRSFEEASTALKSFAEVRSPADLFRLQSEYARAAFDNMVSESSKVSETVIKLAGEVAEPITNRYSAAAERVKTLAI